MRYCMKNIVHIKSTIDCKISINGEATFTNNIDLISANNFFIGFFPNNHKSFLPIATSFNSINTSCIKKIPFKNNHFDLIFTPNSIPSNNETIILCKKYKNTIFKITNSHHSFINIDTTNFSHKSFCHTLSNIQFDTKDEIVIIRGITSNNENYLLLYNCKTRKIIIENIFNNIEINSKQIKAIKKQSMLLDYGKITSFDFQTKKLDCYNVYLSESDADFNNNNLIALAFLESVMNKDYSNAKKYLLKQDIKNEFMQSYFGNIEDIYFDGYSTGVNFTIKSDSFKSYSFTFEGNKILEIEENILT